MSFKEIKIKKRLLLVTILGVLGFGIYGFQEKQESVNPEKDKILIEALRFILEKGHYEPKLINDDLSVAVYNSFLEALDPYKRYFLQTDIEEFNQYKFDIDNQLFLRRIDFFNLVMNRYKLRLSQSEGFYASILQNPFDYSKDEFIDIGEKTIEYPKTIEDHKDNWRKHLKLSTINRLSISLNIEDDLFKKDATYKKKSFEELEKKARDLTEKNIGNIFYYQKSTSHEENFEMYLNCITEYFDPHTTYFSPDTTEKFQESMQGSLEGIGARLQDERGYTKIVELIIGGPAHKQGELEVGDYILKVAQGDEEPVDIIGMRLTEGIKLIKGKSGSIVKLTVKKPDNSIRVISITRDRVNFEETYVKSSVTEKEGQKFGIIHLPKFYIDFSTEKNSNCAKDIEREIKELKGENVQGIAIDLRNNGGGSLQTAIEIAGMFIDKGPVVQVKYRNHKPQVKRDKNIDVLWDGPLVILVNELSASASEILAAAMQDYKRGIIIGSKHTYGKGTVQNIIPINQYINYKENLGALKLTIQKFYRINGGSTQLEGVYPDITTPSRYGYLKIGERDQDTPLAWDQINQAKYLPKNTYSNYDEVIKNAKKRINNSPDFQKIDEYAQWIKGNQEDQVFSLNLTDYRKEEDEKTKEVKQYENIYEYKSPFDFMHPIYEEEIIVNDTILRTKRERWHEQLEKDIYVAEAVQVLSELVVNK